MKIKLSELRRIVNDVLAENAGTSSDSKHKADKRKTVDATRDAISNAVTHNLREKMLKMVPASTFLYKDIEIIDEPPKTLIRLVDADGEQDKDVIYMINVTKLI